MFIIFQKVLGIVGLQSIDCNATKNLLLIKVLKGVLKISENFQQKVYSGVPFQKIAGLQTAVLNLAYF